MYYDEDGTLKEAGPSAASERAADDAELEGWYKVELHVYPPDQLPAYSIGLH